MTAAVGRELAMTLNPFLVLGREEEWSHDYDWLTDRLWHEDEEKSPIPVTPDATKALVSHSKRIGLDLQALIRSKQLSNSERHWNVRHRSHRIQMLEAAIAHLSKGFPVRC